MFNKPRTTQRREFINKIFYNHLDIMSDLMVTSEDAKEYMARKEIPQLIESVLSALLYNRPEDHVDFIQECLNKAKRQETIQWDSFLGIRRPQEDQDYRPRSDAELRELEKVFETELFDDLPSINDFTSTLDNMKDTKESAKLST